MEKQTENKGLEEYKNIIDRYKTIRNYFQEKGEDYDSSDRINQNKNVLFKLKNSCIEEAYNVLHSENIPNEEKNTLAKKLFKLREDFNELLDVGLILDLKKIGENHEKKRLERQDLIDAYIMRDPEGGIII